MFAWASLISMRVGKRTNSALHPFLILLTHSSDGSAACAGRARGDERPGSEPGDCSLLNLCRFNPVRFAAGFGIPTLREGPAHTGDQPRLQFAPGFWPVEKRILDRKIDDQLLGLSAR